MRNMIFKMFFALSLLSPGAIFADGPSIAVINGKLVKVENILDPKLTISGAENPIMLGELVILKANLTDHIPEYIKDIKYKWDIPNKNFFDEKDKVFFGAGVVPTQIKANLSIAISYNVDGEIVLKTVSNSININIQGIPVPPNPTPNPIPTPTPNLSDDAKYMLNSFNNDIQMDNESKKKLAEILSNNFKIIAKNISDNKYTDIKVAITELKQYNENTIFNITTIDKLNVWENNFKQKTWEKYQNGSLKVINDYALYFTELSKGLEAYK